MTLTRTARRAASILVACGAAACGSSGSSADDTSGSEAAQTAATSWADAASIQHVTIAGMKTDLLGTSKDLKSSFDAMEQAFPSNGYIGLAARVSDADLKTLLADPNKLVHFIDLASQYDPKEDQTATTDEITATLVKDTGNKRLSILAKGLSQSPKSASLKRAVNAMLAQGARVVYDTSWCPDWCDEAEIVVTTSGEIRAIVAFGDQ